MNINYNKRKLEQKEILLKYNTSKSKKNKSILYKQIMDIEIQLEKLKK